MKLAKGPRIALVIVSVAFTLFSAYRAWSAFGSPFLMGRTGKIEHLVTLCGDDARGDEMAKALMLVAGLPSDEEPAVPIVPVVEMADRLLDVRIASGETYAEDEFGVMLWTVNLFKEHDLRGESCDVLTRIIEYSPNSVATGYKHLQARALGANMEIRMRQLDAQMADLRASLEDSGLQIMMPAEADPDAPAPETHEQVSTPEPDATPTDTAAEPVAPAEPASITP
ncbi:MAG: hypothetical protein PF961_23235 [Planctomycetota bacterium]|jgi:hypothetical protein|nr:hypothetical protein [Planctomycetota bacterium]